MKETGYLHHNEFDKLSFECNELLAMLVSSIKTAKSILNKL